MKTIHHVSGTTAPRETLFAALTTTQGLSGWRASIVKAEAGVGAIVHFTFAGDFNPDMRVTALEPPAVVCRECVGGHEPWAQNTFRFELADKGDGTIVRFWQDYARELSDDAYGTYNFSWGYYLESLRLFSDTGSGKPFQAGSAPAGVTTSNDALVRRSTEEFKNQNNSRLRGTRPARRDAKRIPSTSAYCPDRPDDRIEPVKELPHVRHLSSRRHRHDLFVHAPRQGQHADGRRRA